MWFCVTVMAWVAAAKADAPLASPLVAQAQPDQQVEPLAQPQSETHQQLAELSQRIDNLIKVSQQQQRIGQYQLVALAAISVLLVVLLASGLARRRGI